MFCCWMICTFVDADFRRFLRESCPNPVKIIGWRAAPTVDYSVFRDVDLMLTCTPLFARQMREHGVNAELMMHAFEPSILQMTSDSEARDIDFSFVGGIVLKSGFHNERWSLLKSMLSTTNLEIWGSLLKSSKRPASRTNYSGGLAERLILWGSTRWPQNYLLYADVNLVLKQPTSCEITANGCMIR